MTGGTIMVKGVHGVVSFLGVIGISLHAAQQEGREAYDTVMRDYRNRLATIDTTLNKIPLKNKRIKEAHADLLRSFRAIRSEVDTLAQRMYAADSAATTQRIFGQNPISLGPLRAARSRLIAEVSSIRLVQNELLKEYNKRFSFHKDILKLLIDTVGNGLINIANELVNKLDVLIVQIERS